jgi:hypothetical protein
VSLAVQYLYARVAGGATGASHELKSVQLRGAVSRKQLHRREGLQPNRVLDRCKLA